MKKTKAGVFISTAALFAGTACGVYAESGDSVTASFDRNGEYINAVDILDAAKGAEKQAYYTTVPYMNDAEVSD